MYKKGGSHFAQMHLQHNTLCRCLQIPLHLSLLCSPTVRVTLSDSLQLTFKFPVGCNNMNGLFNKSAKTMK